MIHASAAGHPLLQSFVAISSYPPEGGSGRQTLLVVLVAADSHHSVLLMGLVVNFYGATLEEVRFEGPGAGGAVDDKVPHTFRNQLSCGRVQFVACQVREPEGVSGYPVAVSEQPADRKV